MAAPAYSRGLGIRRSAGNDHGAAIYFALPREALQFWLSCMSKSRGSGRAVEAIEAGRDWRAAYGRVHDGSGSERERAGVPSSGLHVFQRRGRPRRLISLPSGIETLIRADTFVAIPFNANYQKT